MKSSVSELGLISMAKVRKYTEVSINVFYHSELKKARTPLLSNLS